MTILQDLFYGNILPNTDRFDESSVYAKTIQTIDDNEEKLLSLLKDREKKLFIDFCDAYSSLNGFTAEKKFILGFRLGALMMLEIIGYKKERE